MANRKTVQMLAFNVFALLIYYKLYFQLSKGTKVYLNLYYCSFLSISLFLCMPVYPSIYLSNLYSCAIRLFGNCFVLFKFSEFLAGCRGASARLRSWPPDWRPRIHSATLKIHHHSQGWTRYSLYTV